MSDTNFGIIHDDNAGHKQTEELLLNAGALRAAILNSVNFSTIATDANGVIRIFNAGAERLHGYSASEVVDKVTPADLSDPKEVIERARALSVELGTPIAAGFEALVFKASRGIEDIYDLTYIRKNGSRFPAVVSVTALCDTQGGIIGYLLIGTDNSARQHTQEALQESQQITEGIINALSTRVFWKDKDLVYRGCNAAFARDAGVSDPKEILGKTDYQMVWRDQAEKFRADDRHVIESGCADLLIEESLTTPNGSILALLTHKAPLRGSNGEIRGVLGTYIDITERKQTESKLQDSEVRYRRLFESARDGILILNADTGDIVDVNPFLEELLGYTHDEFVGKKVWEIGLFADIVANETAFRELQQEKYIRYEHLPLETRAGQKIEVEFVSNVYEVDHAKVIQCNIRDLTERKKAEARQAKLENQIRQQQRIETVGQLAAGVAHDFNNLLTGIIGFTRFAQDTLPEGASAREDLGEVIALASRATDLTRQLLAFSRQQTLQPLILNINEQIAGMIKMLRRLIGEHIDLGFHPAADLGFVKADPGQIEQVLANLAVNARDAMPDGGKLTIETANVELDADYVHSHPGASPGPQVMLAVTDNGCGMETPVLEHAFEPFFTTKGIGKGTGLGLSTVFGIVKQHGGYINIYSEVGSGTAFKVYLPRVFATPEEQISASLTAPSPGTETILIVEDESTVRTVATRILEQHGYHVLTAALPSLADEILAANGENITLLLTDIVMPQRNGRILYEAAHERFPHLRVLYMSGYTDDAVVHQGLLDENTPFIQKPFTARDLLRMVRQTLGEANANP